MKLPDLASGIRTHRAFARRSAKPYAKRIANAEHYAVWGSVDDIVIEPLAWSLMAATGNDHESASSAPALTAGTYDALFAASWQRVDPADARFDALWDALKDWCTRRHTAPSARTGRTAKEDRVFWLPPVS